MLFPARFLGLTLAFLGCAAALVTACAEDDVIVRGRDGGAEAGSETPLGDGGGNGLACGATIQTVYIAPNFATNAAAEIALTANLTALDAKMASVEGDKTPAPAPVTATDLANIYNAGAPSLRTVASSASQATIDAYLAAFGAAQGKTWAPADATADGGAATGGKIDSGDGKPLFYESPVGVDLRAATGKTIYGGSLYNWALTIMAQPMNDVSVDRLLALYGASTALANRTDVDAGSDGDRFVAELASKRDDKSQPDPGGLYRKMKTTLLRMKAAATKLPDCQTDLDIEIGNFRSYWEQATYASAIYSLNAAAKSAVDPNQGALTLHSFGDALGLIQSFKSVPADKRKINDAQIDTVLTQIGAATPYKLVTDPGTQVQGLNSAIANIALFEGFDAAAVESFKKSF